MNLHLFLWTLFFSISSSFIVSPDGTRFLDSYGRERFFRGVNVVFKGYPYIPFINQFNTTFSYSIEDIELLQSLGINGIRLGVMWPGVLPEKNQTNSTYLNIVEQILNLNQQYNIYSLLDAHQDAFSQRFCGEGTPLWAFPDHSNPRDFPAPIDTPTYPTDQNGIPDETHCNLFPWYDYLWTYDAASSYQNLYTNSQYNTLFANFWSIVAQRLIGNKNIIGIEILNEPFPGDVFNNSQNRNNTYADINNLTPFYNLVSSQIWSQDRNQLVAYEPSWPVGDQDINPDDNLSPTSGFTQLPTGPQGTQGNIYAFHYYHPPCTADIDSYLDGRVSDAKRLKAAPLLTEFGIHATSQSTMDTMIETFQKLEQRFINYLGWEYKSYYNSNMGICTGCGNPFFNTDGSLNTWMAKSFARPYAYAVQGHALSTNFDSSSLLFTFTFNASDPTTISQPTEIYVSSLWYPQGFNVIVPDTLVKVSITDFPAKGYVVPGVFVSAFSVVNVFNLVQGTGQIVNVTVSPKA